VSLSVLRSFFAALALMAFVAGCRPPARPAVGPATALGSGGERIYVHLGDRVIVLARDATHAPRELARIPAPCPSLLDLEVFGGALFGLCAGGSVHVHEPDGWREVMPAPAAQRSPVALQIASGHLFRVYPDHGGLDSVDIAADRDPAALSLRGAGNPPGGLGVSDMAEVDATTPQSHEKWSDGRPHTAWLTARLGRRLEVVLISERQLVRCTIRGAEILDVAVASHAHQTVFVGHLRVGSDARLFLLDTRGPHDDAARNWDVFDLRSLRPASTRLRCR